jgi:hypothetical protein
MLFLPLRIRRWKRKHQLNEDLLYLEEEFFPYQTSPLNPLRAT